MANITIETPTKTGQAESAQPPHNMSVMGLGVKIATKNALSHSICTSSKFS